MPRARVRRLRAGALGLSLVLAGLVADLTAASAAHATIGTPVADREMATPDGGRAWVLRDAAVNVLLFVRAGQERSVAMLEELAACRKALGARPLHWAIVVSDSGPVDRAAAMVRESGFDAPVLVDRGDELYGSLGIAMHPVLVLVDRDRRLAAFEPYRSVNFCDSVKARIRHHLREISDDELRLALEPPPAVPGGNGAAARHYRALAESLQRAGNPEKALEMARKGLEKDPGSARLHALVGEIELSKGDCAKAVPAFQRALAIDPASAAARTGLERCKTSR